MPERFHLQRPWLYDTARRCRAAGGGCRERPCELDNALNELEKVKTDPLQRVRGLDRIRGRSEADC